MKQSRIHGQRKPQGKIFLANLLRVGVNACVADKKSSLLFVSDGVGKSSLRIVLNPSTGVAILTDSDELYAFGKFDKKETKKIAPSAEAVK